MSQQSSILGHSRLCNDSRSTMTFCPGPLLADNVSQAIGTRVLRATTNLMDGLDKINMTVSSNSLRPGSLGANGESERDISQIHHSYRRLVLGLAHTQQHGLPDVSCVDGFIDMSWG